MTFEEKTILLYILDNQKITRKEAVELTNIQKTKVHEILKILVEDKKLLKRCGNGRSTYYEVAK